MAELLERRPDIQEIGDCIPARVESVSYEIDTCLWNSGDGNVAPSRVEAVTYSIDTCLWHSGDWEFYSW